MRFSYFPRLVEPTISPTANYVTSKSYPANHECKPCGLWVPARLCASTVGMSDVQLGCQMCMPSFDSQSAHPKKLHQRFQANQGQKSDQCCTHCKQTEFWQALSWTALSGKSSHWPRQFACHTQELLSAHEQNANHLTQNSTLMSCANTQTASVLSAQHFNHHSICINSQ